MNPRRTVLLCLAALAVACGETNRIRLQPAYLAASTTEVDFGAHETGTQTPQSLFLINKGDVVLNLKNPSGDLMGGVFTVIVPQPTVAPNDDVVVQLVFQPTEAKDYETTVVFGNDSQNEPKFALKLKGTGVAPDPCETVTCNTPPAPACISSTVSRHYDPIGSCEAGHCSYTPIDETCSDFGCDDASGRCAKDPCIGVSCDTPPNGCYFAQGACHNGACAYTVNNGAACDDGNACTTSDRCQEGTCVGTATVCNAPPQTSVCLDANTLRTWTAAGSCNAQGSCDYPHQDVGCAHGCADGACKGDPCAAGCDDGNPCTTDSCDANGCHHTNDDGASCVTASGACPTGQCRAGQCLAVPGVECQKEFDTDLCATVDVPGTCTAAGECAVQNPPADNTCPDECPATPDNPFSLCAQCTPFPGFQLTVCL